MRPTAMASGPLPWATDTVKAARITRPERRERGDYGPHASIVGVI